MTSTTARATGTTGMPYRKHEGIPGTYDTVVVGSGMGGLALASHLAQAGQKVLLLEQNNIVGGMTQAYSRHGYRWTVGMHYIGEVGNPNGAGWKLFNRVTGGHLRWAPMPAIYNRMVIADRGYRSGPVCLNSFPRFLSGLQAGCGRCRVVHGGGRRLRRTDRRGGQLGAHQRCHLMRPRAARAAWRSSVRPAWPHRGWSARGPRCTSRGSRQCRRVRR